MAGQYYIQIKSGDEGECLVTGKGKGTAGPIGHAIRFDTEAERDVYLETHFALCAAQFDEAAIETARGKIDNEFPPGHVDLMHAYKYFEALLIAQGLVTDFGVLKLIDAEAREMDPSNPDHAALAQTILGKVQAMAGPESQRVARKRALRED